MKIITNKVNLQVDLTDETFKSAFADILITLGEAFFYGTNYPEFLNKVENDFFLNEYQLFFLKQEWDFKELILLN